jgi:hypothetical protein
MIRRSPGVVALVQAGAAFHKGRLLERPIDITPAAGAGQSAGTEEVA